MELDKKIVDGRKEVHKKEKRVNRKRRGREGQKEEIFERSNKLVRSPVRKEMREEMRELEGELGEKLMAKVKKGR